MAKLAVYQEVQKYEDAIDRHGQYVRWYSSAPCYCLSLEGVPDPNCTKCKGRGYRYFPVTTRGRLERKTSFGDNTLTTDYNIKSINRIYKGNNSNVSYDSFSGKTIVLSSSRRKGEYIYVDYEEDKEFSYSGTDVNSYDSDVIFKIGFPSLETVNGNFKGEIVSVSSVYNVTQDSSITVISYWDDLILIDSNDVPAPTDEIQVDCVYVNPEKILISNVKYKTFKGDFIAPTDTADVQATVPGTLEIGRGDIFTMLKAEQKGSFVGRRNTSEENYYQAPFFHIAEILRIEDSTGLITDAVIQNNNEILFDTKPTGNFSCSVKYNPSFMVDENPHPRNAENKIFPRKTILKRLDVLNKKTKSPRFDDEVVY